MFLTKILKKTIPNHEVMLFLYKIAYFAMTRSQRAFHEEDPTPPPPHPSDVRPSRSTFSHHRLLPAPSVGPESSRAIHSYTKLPPGGTADPSLVFNLHAAPSLSGVYRTPWGCMEAGRLGGWSTLEEPGKHEAATKNDGLVERY